MRGSRAYVATGTRVLTADPPWTVWTEHTVAGALRYVGAIEIAGGRVWAGTDSGVFVSTDDAATFVAEPMVTSDVRGLLVLADGALAAATSDGTWISDPAITTWTKAGPSEGVFQNVETGGVLIAATDHGAYVSRNRGMTWTQVAGTEMYRARSAMLDPGTGELVIGTLGEGLVRVPLP